MKNKLTRYASHLVKLELMKSRLDVFENVSGYKGSDFIIKTKSGHYYEISLQAVNLETTEHYVKIPKVDWNYELPDSLLVALVLFMKELEPVVYLIPASTFKNPDGYIFIDNEQSKRFKHLSNWEIKIFTKGIPKLSEFALPYTSKKLL